MGDYASTVNTDQAHTQFDITQGIDDPTFTPVALQQDHYPTDLQNTTQSLDLHGITAQSQVQQHAAPHQTAMSSSIDTTFTDLIQPFATDYSPADQNFSGQPFLDEDYMDTTYTNESSTYQDFVYQPLADQNSTDQAFTTPSLANQNSVDQTFQTQASTPPALEQLTGPFEHLVFNTAVRYYQNLTQPEKQRILDQASRVSAYLSNIGAGQNHDPVMLFCRHRALRNLAFRQNIGVSQPAVTQQPPQSWPEPEVSTSLPQSADCSLESPIVIEERAVPTATPPQPNPVTKPRFVDVTDRMYGECPNENDLIYDAYCTMWAMDKYTKAFQFNRVARSHRWYVCDDDPKNFRCTRNNDGVTTPGWELDATLENLRKGLPESNGQEKQEEKQQDTAEKTARKGKAKRTVKADRGRRPVGKQQNIAEKVARKRKAKADREQPKRKQKADKATSPQRSKRAVTSSDENSSRKKAHTTLTTDDGSNDDDDQELLESCTNLIEMDDDDDNNNQELVDSCTSLMDMDDDDESREEVGDLQYDLESEESEEE